jgi:hypothetical protein
MYFVAYSISSFSKGAPRYLKYKGWKSQPSHWRRHPPGKDREIRYLYVKNTPSTIAVDIIRTVFVIGQPQLETAKAILRWDRICLEIF